MPAGDVARQAGALRPRMAHNGQGGASTVCVGWRRDAAKACTEGRPDSAFQPLHVDAVLLDLVPHRALGDAQASSRRRLDAAGAT